MKKTMKLVTAFSTFIFIAGLLAVLAGCGSTESGGSSDSKERPDYLKVSKKASGTYTYDAVNSNLLFDVTNTEFSGCGPGMGVHEFSVQSVTSTQMIWDVANIQLGIYDGSTFEFEFEFIIPETSGEYVIGSDLDAIDFMNNDTPYNLHAYGGTININSISPLFEGTFELYDLMTRHDNKSEARNIDGNISGSFSVPADGGANGKFTAAGTAGEYAIDINVSDAFVISEKMVWVRDSGADNDVVGSWETTNGEFFATFNADNTFLIEGNCYRWD